MNSEQLLNGLASEIRQCQRCRLCQTRTNAVPGEGNATARLMFVGEGPGEKEDQTGRPFVGRAGNFLNTLLQEAGVPRDDVFITNIVKCRPPQNRDPQQDEIDACNEFLMAQIAIIEPVFICTLGVPALRTLLGKERKISRDHCKVFRKSGILFVPLYHPAAALYRSALRETLISDIRTLKKLINTTIPEDIITDLQAPVQKSTFRV